MIHWILFSVKYNTKHCRYSYTACHSNRVVVFCANPFFFRIAEYSKRFTNDICDLSDTEKVAQWFSKCLSYHVVNSQGCFSAISIARAPADSCPRSMRRLPIAITNAGLNFSLWFESSFDWNIHAFISMQTSRMRFCSLMHFRAQKKAYYCNSFVELFALFICNNKQSNISISCQRSIIHIIIIGIGTLIFLAL